MRTEYPGGNVIVVPEDERTLRHGMNEYRIERYTLRAYCYPAHGVIWRAWAVTNHGAFLIVEACDYDYVLTKMNEFIEAA